VFGFLIHGCLCENVHFTVYRDYTFTTCGGLVQVQFHHFSYFLTGLNFTGKSFSSGISMVYKLKRIFYPFMFYVTSNFTPHRVAIIIYTNTLYVQELSSK